MNSLIRNEPFLVEEIRNYFAEQGKLLKFKSLYTSKFPEIANRNYGKFWDKANFFREGELKDSPIYKDKISNVLTLLKDFKGSLLDVGFGNGYLEEKIKNKNIKLHGVDISSKCVRAILDKVRGDFRKGRIEKLPFSSNMFNCVLLLDVLEHISPKNTFKSLQEVNRVMKKNAKLIISVPLNENLEYLIRFRKVNPNAHVRVYTPDILKTEMALIGFIFVNEKYFCAFKYFYKLKSRIIWLFPFIKRSPNLVLMVFKKK